MMDTAPPRIPTAPNVDTHPVYSEFMALRTESYNTINEALRQDELNDRSAARDLYRLGIQRIDNTLSLNIRAITDHQQAQSIRAIGEKLTATRQHALSRLAELIISEPNPSSNATSPEASSPVSFGHISGLPSYEQAISTTSDEDASPSMRTSADLLMQIEGCQVFHISPEGFVTTPSYPDTLKLCQFDRTQLMPGAPKYFLQLGNWSYPLIDEVTPALQSEHGAYIFPDVTSTQDGACVGLLLSDEASRETVTAFEAVLSDLTALRRPVYQPSNHNQASNYHASASQSHSSRMPPSQSNSRPAPSNHTPSRPPAYDATSQPPARPSRVPARNSRVPSGFEPIGYTAGEKDRDLDDEEAVKDRSTTSPTLTDKIVYGLGTVASGVSWSLEKGAGHAGRFIAWSGSRIRDRIQPSPSDAPVDQRVQNGVMIARGASNKAVEVSSHVVKALGDATMNLARRAAPYIKQQAEKVVPQSMKVKLSAKAEDGKSRVDCAMDVANAGLKGWAQVYLGLESAAKALGRSITEQTSETIKQRYGENAGKLTQDAMFTFGNTLMLSHNVHSLGPKALAKRAAKNTGKALLEPVDAGTQFLPPVKMSELADNDNKRDSEEPEKSALGRP